MKKLLSLVLSLVSLSGYAQGTNSGSNLPQKPEILNVEFRGVFDYDQVSFFYGHPEENEFVVEAVSSGFTGAFVTLKESGDYFGLYSEVPDTCIFGDTIRVSSRNLDPMIPWDWGDTLYIGVGIKGVYGSAVYSIPINVNDYISPEILDYINQVTGIGSTSAVGGRLIVDGLTLTIADGICALYDLRGIGIVPRSDVAGTTFTVPRHGVYILRIEKNGKYETRKIRL